MITIRQHGAGRIDVDGDPVVIQNYDERDNIALLCCKSGRNVWITGSDFLTAVMLPKEGRLIAIEVSGVL